MLVPQVGENSAAGQFVRPLPNSPTERSYALTLAPSPVIQNKPPRRRKLQETNQADIEETTASCLARPASSGAIPDRVALFAPASLHYNARNS
jgi:hypothetical protein